MNYWESAYHETFGLLETIRDALREIAQQLRRSQHHLVIRHEAAFGYCAAGDWISEPGTTTGGITKEFAAHLETGHFDERDEWFEVGTAPYMRNYEQEEGALAFWDADTIDKAMFNEGCRDREDSRGATLDTPWTLYQIRINDVTIGSVFNRPGNKGFQDTCRVAYLYARLFDLLDWGPGEFRPTVAVDGFDREWEYGIATYVPRR